MSETSPPQQKPVSPTPAQEMAVAVLSQVLRYQNELKHVPAVSGYISAPEILSLMEIATYYKVDWTIGLELRHAPGRKVPVGWYRVFVEKREEPGIKVMAKKKVPMRREPDMLDHDGKDAGVWLPAFDIQHARLLRAILWDAIRTDIARLHITISNR